MPIPLSCPCGRSLNIKEELAGRKVRCPACREVLTVPEAVPEVEPADLLLEVVPADEPAEREERRAAIQAEPPQPRPTRSRTRDEDDGITPVRRRRDDDRPARRRPKLRNEDVERRSSGSFGTVNAGIIGGLLMMLIAVVWFVLGLLANRIFFYPPILFVLGIVSIIKGIAGNN